MAYFPDPPLKPGDFGADPAGAIAGSVSAPAAAFDPFEDARAMAQFLPLKTEVESAFAGEPDLARPPAEYDTAVVDAIEKSAARISHPAQRKAFTLSAIDDVAATMKGLAQEREKQAQLQGLTADLDALRTTALKIPGDDGKAKIIDTSRALIGGLEQKGLLTPEEARARSRGWVEDYALQALKARPAREQLAIVRSLAEGTNDPETSIFGLIPQEQRTKIEREADRHATVQSITSAVAKADTWKRDITDASEDLRNIPRSAIENDPELDDINRAAVLRNYDQVAKQAASFEGALNRFKNNEAFDPGNPDDRANAGKLYGYFGANDTALKAVVQRTGMLPEPAAKQFRADMESGDPKRVAGAMQTLSQLSADHPSILDGMEGGDDLKKSAGAFQVYTEHSGLTPEEAANNIIVERKKVATEAAKTEDEPGSPDILNQLLKSFKAPGDTLQGNISGDEGTDRAIELGILLTLGRLLGRSGGILKPGSAPAKIPPATGTADAPGGATILKELGETAVGLAENAMNALRNNEKPSSSPQEFSPPNGLANGSGELLKEASSVSAPTAEKFAVPNLADEGNSSESLEKAVRAEVDDDRSVIVLPADRKEFYAKYKEFIAKALEVKGKQFFRFTLGTVKNSASRLPTSQNIDGWIHTIDSHTIQHFMKNHGTADSEVKRGQLPVTAADIEKIPEILASADKIERGGKSKRNKLDTIIYSKRFNGTVIYIEEMRVGQGQLAALSFRKMKR